MTIKKSGKIKRLVKPAMTAAIGGSLLLAGHHIYQKAMSGRQTATPTIIKRKIEKNQPIPHSKVKALLTGTPLEKEAHFITIASPGYGITPEEAIAFFQKQSDLGRKNSEYHNPGALRYGPNGKLRQFHTWNEGIAFALDYLGRQKQH